MIEKPIIDKSLCTECRLCIIDCTAKAINREKIEIIRPKCINCGHCIAICPVAAVSLNGDTGLSLEEPDDSYFNSWGNLVKMRRSIRHYEDRPVDKEIIDKICDTVIHSPTGTNARKTGITILDSREKITELNDIIMRHFETVTKWLFNPLTYPFFRLFIGKEKSDKVFSYKRLIPQYFQGKNILTHDAPLLMIFHGETSASTPEQDGIIWATTAMYTAESLGIGTCFNGFLVLGINTCSKARKYLGLTKGRKVYETFTAGYGKYTYKRTVPVRDKDVTYI